MSKEVKTKDPQVLKSALKALIARLEKAETFVLEQAPAVCKEIIAEQMIKVVMALIGDILLAIISTVLGVIAIKFAFSAYDHNSFIQEFPRVMSGVGGVVGAIVTLIGMAETFSDVKRLLIIKHCPKLVILRELGKLVK